MSGQRVNRSWPSRRGSAMFLTRGLVAAAVVAMVVAACGTPAATPSHSPSSSPGASPSPTPIATWVPPASLVPSATEAPSESPTPSASPSSAKLVAFPMVMGTAPLAAPASDAGAIAGAEINDFGLKLFRDLDAKSNLCVSPTSIALALAMVRPGAKGQTAAEMDKVLPGLGTDADAPELAALMANFAAATQYTDSNGYPIYGADATPDPGNPEPATELNVADQAFVQKGLAIEPAYLDALSSRFGAGAGLLDFMTDPEAARLAINKWASDQTKGRIPNVLQPPQITNGTRIALANAIYLKAAWNSKFDPALTKPAAFTTAVGTKVTVPTMAIDRVFGYTAGAGYKAVELPYSGNMSMTVVVPDNMASFVGGLTADKLKKLIVYGEQEYDVDLTLPRFSIDSHFELSEALKAMGMPTLFSDAADLSGITTAARLMVTAVVHEANIDVVESGTTAAAVTVVVGATAGGGPQDPPIKVQFHVNKPFLYFIRDYSDGAVLFMGRVNDPSK
jgi:serpin B